MKRIIIRLSGLFFAFSVVATLCLTGCTGAPAVAASHYTHGDFNDSFKDCLNCHQTGSNGAPKEPANHSGYTNGRCLKCHKPTAN